MIDAHIHLEQYDHRYLRSKIEEWKQNGIQGLIAVSNDLESSYRTLELREKFPDFVYAAIGFHPEQDLPSEKDFQEWVYLLWSEKKKITAIGEIGLPHYNLDKLSNSLEHYYEFLSRCLDVAKATKLPVAIHAVHDKTKLVLELLQEKQITHAHFHWLKAPDQVVKQIVDAGYYISVTPEVCYRERDQKLTRLVPTSQLLIETDGPWPYDDLFKAHPTTSLFLKNVVKKLAELKKVDEIEMIKQTISNTQTCYQLDRTNPLS